jgi:putative copper resistance protein D
VTSSADLLSVIFRAASFVLLFQSAGAAMFLAVFGRGAEGALPTIRRLGLISALSAILCSAIYYLLEAARMTGEMSGVFDPSMQRVALVSSTGLALGCRVGGLALIAAGMGKAGAHGSAAGQKASPSAPRGSAVAPIASLGVALVVASFVLTGHLATDAHRFALTVLMVVHVVIGMFWFGSLLPLCLVTARERGALAAQVVESFSSKAAWLVPCIFLAGLVMTAVLVPDLRTFTQPYGEILIAKASLFALLMGLAALNRLRLGPALASDDATATARFRRVVVAELVLICAVLTITAWLTEFYSPIAE